MNFDLPGTESDQSPVFLNAADCRAWLTRLPLANAAQAQPMIFLQLNLLHRYALPPTTLSRGLRSVRDSSHSRACLSGIGKAME